MQINAGGVETSRPGYKPKLQINHKCIPQIWLVDSNVVPGSTRARFPLSSQKPEPVKFPVTSGAWLASQGLKVVSHRGWREKAKRMTDELSFHIRSETIYGQWLFHSVTPGGADGQCGCCCFRKRRKMQIKRSWKHTDWRKNVKRCIIS